MVRLKPSQARAGEAVHEALQWFLRGGCQYSIVDNEHVFDKSLSQLGLCLQLGEVNSFPSDLILLQCKIILVNFYLCL